MAMVTLLVILAAAGLCFGASVEDLSNGGEEGEWFEGDVLLTGNQRMQLRNGLVIETYRWPNKTVPYVVGSGFTAEQADHIRTTLEKLNRRSCVIIRPATDEDKDYVRITAESTGCWSQLGFRGGEQQLNLAPSKMNVSCMRAGSIMHEMLHTLGFLHMQSASDRDDYVTIMWDNIMDDKKRNFNKYGESVITSFGVPYDYGSVMHYGPYAFSKNNQKTIVPHKEGAHIGQREDLSNFDAVKIDHMYKCPM